MEAMTLVLDQRRWTREERDALPDDGHRHELIDGALVVTPSPKPLHQLMSSNLVAALQARCPQHLRVLHAPTDVALADDTVLQPDVLVVARAQIGPERIDGVPLLAVEILSPSSRMVDRNLKLPRFERAGCPSFWLLDPQTPSLTAWDLDAGGRYVEVAHVPGDSSWTAALPFPVTITPADLLS